MPASIRRRSMSRQGQQGWGLIEQRPNRRGRNSGFTQGDGTHRQRERRARPRFGKLRLEARSDEQAGHDFQNPLDMALAIGGKRRIVWSKLGHRVGKKAAARATVGIGNGGQNRLHGGNRVRH